MSEPIWAQMIGQERPLGMLARAAELDRVAQAYLFCGPAGVGKTLAARGLAQRLNCDAAKPPCGGCENCRRAAAGDPAHLMVVEPEQQKGVSVYRRLFHKIEPMRQLLQDLALRGFGEQTRVIVIRLAEHMDEQVQDTMLKVLEEPPPRVVLVLTSEQPASLLPTVLSRTVRLEFTPIPTAAIAAWLIDRHQVDEPEATTLARSSAGRPARALALAQDPRAAEVRRVALDLAASLRRKPPAAALVAAQKLLAQETEDSGGAWLELALDLLEWWFRDALVLAAGGGAERVVNQDRAAALADFARGWSRTELSSALAALHQARQLLRRNANETLVLEVLWLRLARGGQPAGVER